MNSFLADIRHEFQRHKKLADGALEQLDDESFFRRPSDVVNPLAIIVKHLSGNLLSRWTDFLTTDGDKPTRNRDGEFTIEPADTREQLMVRWQTAWATVFATIDSLQETDLVKTVTIRGEPHTAQQALIRGLTHVAYHVGQITYVSRLWNPEGKWLTIAPGQSASHKPGYRKN